MEPQPDAQAKAGGQESRGEESRATQGPGRPGVAFDIASVQLDRSALTYIDKASGQELALTDVKLSTGRIAEKADGKLELKASAKGKNRTSTFKLDVSGGYKFDLGAKSLSRSKLTRNDRRSGRVHQPEREMPRATAPPIGKDEYKVNGLALDVKGCRTSRTWQAHIAAPELLITADNGEGRGRDRGPQDEGGRTRDRGEAQASGVEGSAKRSSFRSSPRTSR